MANTGQNTRRKKMDLVYRVIKRYPDGVSEREIADELDMGDRRRTINNYLRDLELEGKIYKEEYSTLWFALPYENVKLRGIDLSPEEAMTLYLAVRLLVKQHDKQNDAAQLALTKLAEVLTGDAGVGHEIYQAALELTHRPGDETYARIFRTMMQSYIYRRKVAITYKPLNEKPFETTFAPYLFEPSAIGFATYVIGHSSLVNSQRTYKLQRIQSATLTRKEYVIPTEFPGLEILGNAWSIIHGDTLIPVKLRFSPNVAERVRESQWHPSQEPIADDPDKPGWIIWTAKVADLTDLTPWVRSWGADVEVLGPEGLRDEIKINVWKMTKTYNLTPQATDINARLLRLWGKTGKTDEDFHPALYHMLDVGHVAQHLLTVPASLRWRHVLSLAFNTEPDTLIDWLPWLVALHDIGKISVLFQGVNENQKLRMESEGFGFGRWKPKDYIHHSTVGAMLVSTELKSDLPAFWQRLVEEMMNAHHGSFEQPSPQDRQTFKFIQEPDEWPKLRAKALHILKSYLLRQLPNPWPEPTNLSAAVMALTGFTILCDWLGSDSRYFTPHPYTDLLDYVLISRQKACEIVEKAGFFQPSRSDTPTTFETLFPSRTPARPLQQAIDAIPANLLAYPCLAIIEAPTGEGKTEAALALAHRLAQFHGSDEFYCALPTTATSNQMFLRIQEYLRDNLNLPTQAHLVHGQAFLVKDDLQIEPLGDAEPSAAPEWFGPKKRALLAPFGVGTIDQAELAALNVRHNALRLIGLAGKVIILDEVHAYDTYMTTIIEQMLRWLSALGSSVILLSATLPLSRRAALARAYGVEMETSEVSKTSEVSAAYPSLWLGSRAGTHHVIPPAPERKFYLNHLHLLHDDAAAKAHWLVEAVAEGGCVCWIANTVDRAQQLARAIEQLNPTIDCLLLHARFPLADRQQLEDTIRHKYGPGGERPARSIVIGTQVLEQSLDLDFDLMVSDLAPIDLLLQRMGRVHRHKNQRPAAHIEPRFFVNCELDPLQQDIVKMGADRFYTEYILQKTWQTIAAITTITLPADYRPLVEAVYGSAPPVPDEPLFDAWQKLRDKEDNAESKANERLLPDPKPRRPFSYSDQYTFVEDEDSAAWVVAQTRLGEETITLIPLEREGDKARLIPTVETVSLTVSPTRETELALLRRSLRVSQWHMVQHFKRLAPPDEPLFKKSNLLKSIQPLWLINGKTQLTIEKTTFILTLDPKLGLFIEKERSV